MNEKNAQAIDIYVYEIQDIEYTSFLISFYARCLRILAYFPYFLKLHFDMVVFL